MGAPNRNQHWVPQFYLKYFATPDSRDTKSPKIWAFPTRDREGEEFRTHTRNVAAKRDLYAFCKPEVDKRLTDLESMLGRFWPTISAERYPLDLGFKRGLSLFIATLYLRHPAELERQRRALTSMARVFMDGLPDDHGSTAISTVKAGHATYEVDSIELERMRTLTDDGIKQVWGQTILTDSGWIAQQLIERPWTVLITPEPAFITNDQPVVLRNGSRDDAPILHADTSICFPMTPSKLVLINQNPERSGELVLIEKGQEAVFNYDTFCKAFRHVFSAWDPVHVMRQVISVGDWARAELKRQVDQIVGPITGIGRNDPCYCGSGRKFKKCCGR